MDGIIKAGSGARGWASAIEVVLQSRNKSLFIGLTFKMTGPFMWRHLNSVSTKSLFLLALAYTKFFSCNDTLEVCAQHSPPLPVSVPTIMKHNSNHSLPNGGVARVEDHITLTTKRKPWREVLRKCPS